jgi:hypothetical protein
MRAADSLASHSALDHVVIEHVRSQTCSGQQRLLGAVLSLGLLWHLLWISRRECDVVVATSKELAFPCSTIPPIDIDCSNKDAVSVFIAVSTLGNFPVPDSDGAPGKTSDETHTGRQTAAAKSQNRLRD